MKCMCMCVGYVVFLCTNLYYSCPFTLIKFYFAPLSDFLDEGLQPQNLSPLQLSSIRQLAICYITILMHSQVISIILDPYYKNQTKIFKCDEYHAGVILMRIPTNLFGLPKQHKLDVRIQLMCCTAKLIWLYTRKTLGIA